MILEHIGLSQINGSLVVLDGVKGVQYDEMAELHLDDGSTRVGRVVRVDGDRCVIQVFEGTRGLSLVNNRTVLTGHPMMMDLSPELLGRLDEVLVFGPLAQEDLVAIGETLLRELEARAAQQGIRLAHTPAAARLLVREAYEPSSGARSLRRAITRRVEQCLAQQLLGGVENGAAADFLLDAPQDVLSLARRCGTAANAAQGGVRGGGEADAPEQNAAAPAPDTVQACNL